MSPSLLQNRREKNNPDTLSTFLSLSNILFFFLKSLFLWYVSLSSVFPTFLPFPVRFISFSLTPPPHRFLSSFPLFLLSSHLCPPLNLSISLYILSLSFDMCIFNTLLSLSLSPAQFPLPFMPPSIFFLSIISSHFPSSHSLFLLPLPHLHPIPLSIFSIYSWLSPSPHPPPPPSLPSPIPHSA